MMNFIFFWRLAKEKGFDLLVSALSNIVDKTGELPGNISIFGEGDLRGLLFQTFGESLFFEDCSQLTEEEMLEKIEMLHSFRAWDQKKVYFFGWQAQTTIRSVLQASHFALIPSRFLETFGLSALESLSEGVPVIGFQKWGLVPFIPNELSVPFSLHDDENIEALSNKILEVSEVYSGEYSPEKTENILGTETWNGDSRWKILSNRSRYIADSYTEGRWMEQVQSILPKHSKRILLVSDYMTLLGGIETHVQTIARAFRHQGYEVEVFGWNLKKGKWTRVWRLLGLWYSLGNITFSFGIRKKIQEYHPDIIWLHSVSRFLGPLVVREVNRSNIFSLVTYHDLGLWCPFPSKVESEEMIPKTRSLSSFLGVIVSNNPCMYLAAYGKYFQVFVLGVLLKGIDIHIVPSAFLARYVRDIGGIPKEKVVVLEHFL